jgi:hypothetical protein
MDFNQYLKENLNTDFPPLYHGTSSEKLVQTHHFNTKDVYLTDDEEEARGFAEGKHLGGAHGKNKFILTILAKKGKIYDGNDEVNLIVQEEHEKFNDLDEFMNWVRLQNYHYVTFYHPSFDDEKDETFVVVSLFPNKDLKILTVDEV